IVEIGPIWDTLVHDEHLARSAYLRTLERTNPDHLKNLYLLIHLEDQAIGAILLQSAHIRPGDSFDYANYNREPSLWKRLWIRFQQWFVSLFSFRMLCIGNLYLTGQYGVHMDQVPVEDRDVLLQKIVRWLRKELCGTEYRFSGALFKDFFDHECLANPQEHGLISFQIDPNMILPIRSSWLSFDDYLLDMRSKYRIRLKSAMRKFDGITRRELCLPEVKEYNADIYRLYNEILDGSGFVLARGDEDYFMVLKEELGDHFHLIGYFMDDTLIGFYTWVLDGPKMDSHFIGIDPAYNLRHQLYLNILLDLVRDSINEGAKQLYYFRTALEIKSSIGAEPHDMTCYFKHMNTILSRLVAPTAFRYFVPAQEWTQRHPFKKMS
ncbi:MAG: GNAT family N-acetyltransferase, partial [Bacteroidota bacterium]